MAFIEGKVAIVTGGCSGIGFAVVRAFLRNGAKGVTVVDCNPQGEQIVQDLTQIYDSSTLLFVKADVSVKEEFERAFLETIKKFENIDILVNNAGILNDAAWEREIAINMNGTINGCIMALHDYIPKYKSGDEGIIVNLSSTAGLEGYPNIPVYCGTKHAIIGMGRSWGHEKHYNETKVRVLTICPNATDTVLLAAMPGRNLGSRYEKIFRNTPLPIIQSPNEVGDILVKIMDDAKSGSVWLIEEGKYCEVNLPTIETLRNF